MKKNLFRAIGVGIVIVISGLSINSHIRAEVLEQQSSDGNIITCPIYKTGDPSENEDIAQNIVSFPLGKHDAVIPIEIEAKGVLCSLLFETKELEQNTLSQYDIKISIYKDQTCTQLLDSKKLDNFLGIYYQSINIPKEGSYYIKISILNLNENYIPEFCFMPALINSTHRELIENEWAYSASFDKNEIYYKVVTDEEGYINFHSDDSVPYTSNVMEVTLCDLKKRPISDTCNIGKNDNEAIYAVTPGTYYFKVTAATTDQEKAFTDYRIKYGFTKLSELSGKDQKTAKKITIGGENRKGLQTVQNNMADWYKISLEKGGYLSLSLEKGITSGDLTLTLYNSKMKKVVMSTDTLSEVNHKITTYSTVTKVGKGTYYVVINKKNSKTSGFYSLEVK